MPLPPFSLPPVLPGDFRRSFRRDPLGVLQRMAGSMHAVVVIRTGLRRLVLVNDPTLIEALLITHRDVFAPAPLPRGVRRRTGMGPEDRLGNLDPRLVPQPGMIERTLQYLNAWENGETVDFREAMAHLARSLAVPIELADALGSSLAFAADLLARHPAAGNRLHAELAAILGDTPPGFEDLARLPHTGRAFDEVLRYYPPVWAVFRSAPRPKVVLGHRIPAGLLVVSPYTLHRDERYWSSPHFFDPDRFTPWATAKRPAPAFLPFGAADRTDSAAEFLRSAGTLILATLMQRWHLQPLYDLPLPLHLGPFLRPAVPLPIVLHRRSN